ARPAFVLLREQVRSWTPERAEAISTVPAATIRRIAREYGEAARIGSTIVIDGQTLPYRPVAVMYFKGAQGHRNAWEASLAMELLTEVVGAANVPGGLLGMNACSLGRPETERPLWVPSADADGLLLTGTWVGPPPYPPAEVRVGEQADGRDLVPTCPTSSGLVPLSVQQPERFGIPYRVEFNFHVGSNYLMTMANPRQVAEAFKPMFQVSFSLFLDESTDLSDVVLPAASYLERLTQIPDWISSNTAVDAWSYHVRQPVVPPAGQRRAVAEVVLDLAERLDMREELYTVLNTALNLQGPHALDPARRSTWAEIVDRQYRAWFGDERGLEWFKARGLLTWPKRVEEVYWLPFSSARVPVYPEWMLDVGEQVERALRGLRLEADTAGFSALPGWRPCVAHEQRPEGADLFAIYYKVPLQTFSGTYNNPWLAEVSEINPFVYRAAINSETARRRGISDGDWVRITSARTGDSLRMRAAVTEGIHPEVVAIAGCGGHWSRNLPVANQAEKGGCFEWLVPVSLDTLDLPTLTLDTCVRVSVVRE
ncbi:MAG: molybdopterin-binding protein, partial [Chloroflexi bacterium]|nr:molybdopterin-binding protein [Chloroflexota bacterium]